MGCRRQVSALLWTLVIAFLTGCEREDELEIHVLSAASTADAMAEVIGQYLADRDVTIRLITGGSNHLARQIRAGAPASVFLSADERCVEGLGDFRPLLSNQLCVIVPVGGASKQVERLALADEAVPAGRYAREALPSLPFSDASIVQGQHVRAALAWVARGEADAGIVYVTDAMTSEKVEIAQRIEPSLYSQIVYPAVLLKSDEATEAFFEYLFSPPALEIFERHGFRILK